MSVPKSKLVKDHVLPSNAFDAIAHGFDGPAHQRLVSALLKRDLPISESVSPVSSQEESGLFFSGGPGQSGKFPSEGNLSKLAELGSLSLQKWKEEIVGIWNEWRVAASALQANFAVVGLRSVSREADLAHESQPQLVAILEKGNVLLKVTAEVASGDLHLDFFFLSADPLPSGISVATPLFSARAKVDSTLGCAHLVFPGAKLMDWSEIDITIDDPAT